MSYKALYRKWRPATFSEVYGQDQVTSILKYQVANGRQSHAYLFCGSRGTGKTSCAKILAKALNCLDPQNGEPCGKCDACKAVEEGRAIDVIEMDAASNNRVDDMREIIDNISYTPAALKYRVYIVDEVHMLTDSAFNALLKTLEEPPSYIVFVLATTELNRLPSTIISRCQRFDFMRIPAEVLSSRMKVIAETEGATITDDGAFLIAKLANGGFRDAISLLEMCISKHLPIDEQLVADTLGICGSDVISTLVTAVAQKNVAEIFRIMLDAERSSKDIAVFWSDIVEWYRNMLVIKTVDSPEKFLACTSRELGMLKATAALFDVPRLLYHSRLLDGALASMRKTTTSKRNIAELTLIRMSDPSLSDENDALLARIEDLENKLIRLSAGGVVAAPAVAQQPEKVPEAPFDAPAPTYTDDVPPVDAFAPPPEDNAYAPVEPEAPASPSADESPMWWEEVVEKVTAANASAGGYLRGTPLVKRGDCYEISVRGRTGLMILNREATMRMLCDYMTALSGSTVTADKIKITVAAAKAQARPGDELFN
ncbi:MAG: DNA polymerase III subunit gamma/tau [Clostridia bacterium]|nr:DNA polymerase III subunit gamma/tau [Clostridia bacterium]